MDSLSFIKNRFSTLSSKASAVAAGLIVLLSLTLIFYFSSTYTQLFNRTLEEKGLNLAKWVAKSGEYAILVKDPIFLSGILKAAEGDEDLRYVDIYDGKGYLLVSTIATREILPVTIPHGNPVTGFQNFEGKKIIYISYPVRAKKVESHFWENEKELSGVINIGLSLERITKERQTALFFSIVITMIAVLISIWIAIQGMRLITQPLKRLTQTVRAYAAGDLDTTAAVEGKDEIGNLGNEFNIMAAKLKGALKSEEDYERLKVVDVMKSDFISTVSHELQTPLTPIMSYAEMLSDGTFGELPLPQARAIEEVKKQSTHLSHLINSLLAISQIEYGKLKLKKGALSLREAINIAFGGLRTEYEKKKIKFVLECADEAPTIIADESEIDRAITSILENAHKFTPTGGEVKVSVSSSADAAIVRIKDRGIGIAEKDREKIFDKFYQADNSITRESSGMGVGLYIARMIIEAHGGKIRAESTGLGHGTSIVFTLPIEAKEDGEG